MEFMNIVEELRKRRGLTQKALAIYAGLDPATYSDWKQKTLALRPGESGEEITANLKFRQGIMLAKMLGVPPEDLLFPEEAGGRTVLASDEQSVLDCYRANRPYATKDEVIVAIGEIANRVKYGPPAIKPSDAASAKNRLKGHGGNSGG